MALYVGSLLGFGTMMILWYVLGSEKGGAIIGSTLLNMAVFGAMISYAMQGLSFILLRKNMPNIIRPYRSPVGVPGAVVTIVVALVTLWYQLQDPIYQKAVLRGVPRSTCSASCTSRCTAGTSSSSRPRKSSRPARARKVTPEGDGAHSRAVSGEPGARRESGAPLIL